MKEGIYIIGLMLMVWSCQTTKPLVLQVAKDQQVPFSITCKDWSNRLGGRWFFNGKERKPSPLGEILIYKSGPYEVEYRYYENGQVISTKGAFEALPPLDYCNVAIETSKGVMIAELNRDLAPRHSDYFERLIQGHYYDSLIFHRIVPSFVIQGGNAEETPFKRSSEEVMTREMDAEMHDDLLHYKGALAMARMPDQVNPEKKSSPDQFYIVQGGSYNEERWEQFLTDKGGEYKSYQKEKYLSLGGAPQLDGEYSVFGQVILGLEVIDSLAFVPTKSENPIDPEWMIISKVE